MVWILNSSITSTVGVYFTSVTPPFCSIPVRGAPSSSTSEALFRTPLETKLVPPPVGMIPGASRIRLSGLRPLSGVDMMKRFSTTWPKFAEVVFNSGADAATSTTVVTSPTVSSRSTVACCCTSSRKAGRVVFRNPGASTLTTYRAGGKVGNMYRPAVSDTVG